MRKYIGKRAIGLLFVFAVIASLSVPMLIGGGTHDAYAGAEVIGNPNGATDKVVYAPAGRTAKRVVYFNAGAQTPVGISTPVNSDTFCDAGSTVQRIDAYLVGTMTGTAPTLTIAAYHSLDGGTTWISAGTWTVINATVTPASQTNTFGDVYNATTPTVYGDCWKVTKTYGGSGSVGANVEIVGLAK